jgi:two-component system nitrate/nitrite response regulator NarL
MNQITQPISPPIRVMIIDDHPTMLWGLSQLISGETPRMKVIGTARNAEEACTQIKDVVPDIVLLDLDLDGDNGLDLMPTLLANPATRVLILTGERQQTVLDQAVQKGARGILRKDASAEQVLKAIEKIHQGEIWLDRCTLGRVFTEFLDPTAAHKPDPEAEMRASLTGRERNIIQMIVEGQGASNKVLASKLFISEHTLRNHLTSIYNKLDLGNRLELYVYAVKHQLGGMPRPRTAGAD